MQTIHDFARVSESVGIEAKAFEKAERTRTAREHFKKGFNKDNGARNKRPNLKHRSCNASGKTERK